VFTQRLIFDCQRAHATIERRMCTRPTLSPFVRKTLYGSHHDCSRQDSLVSGGDSGARTRNLRLAKPALSQLSYIPAGRSPERSYGPGALVGLGGLEPPTSRLSGVRSNQLSYRPTPRNDAEEVEPAENGCPYSPSLALDPDGIRAWPNPGGTNRARPDNRPSSSPAPASERERIAHGPESPEVDLG
jgi:hypothetical protein